MKQKWRWTSARKSYLAWMVILGLGWMSRGLVARFGKSGSEVEWVVDTAYTRRVDSLNAAEQWAMLQPFNPNFFTDFRAYLLRLPDTALVRLRAFRANGTYVQNTSEFQRVTGVSDDWMEQHARWFRFPEFATRTDVNAKRAADATFIGELNQLNVSELQIIRGIGPALSDRIVTYRSRLGGFVAYEQLDEIFGLSDEVKASIKRQTRLDHSKVRKIAINEVGMRELLQHPYFNYACAKELVVKRSMDGKLLNVENMSGICAFSSNKLKIIALYLEF